MGSDLRAPVPDVALINVALITHWTALINVKLPRLNQLSTLQAGMEILAAIGGIVTEQRATGQDAVNRYLKEQTKTPNQYFRASVLHLLRMCQVPDSNYLPGIYHSLVLAGKKKAWLTIMQMALYMSAEELGCTVAW